MAKYLVQASYTAEGYKGLINEKGTGRKAAVTQAVKKLGGKLESMYFCLGEYDVVLIVDMPDVVSTAALGAAASATGMVRTRTTTLLSIAEADEAFSKTVVYRAPGN